MKKGVDVCNPNRWIAIVLYACAAACLAAHADCEHSLDSVPWIGDGQPERNGADWYDEDPAPEFTAEFVLPEGMKETKAHFACAGFGGFVFNGDPARKINGLETVWSVYDKTVYSTSRNVKVASKKDPFDMWLLPYPATNTVHVRLGNGFYNPPPLRFWGAKCFRETLAHGRPCFKFSIDGLDKPLEWKWRKTNILRNSVYLGVEVDASRPADKEWKPAAVVAGPKGKIVKWRLLGLPPTTVSDNPDSLGKAHWLKEGEVQVVDFGRNASAVPEFYFYEEAPGTRIEIVYGERLNADGSVNPLTQTAGQIKSPGMGGPGAPDLACQRDVFVCGGRHVPPIAFPWDTFRPPFTWHVFRYAEIRGAKNLLVRGRAFRNLVSTLREPKRFKADDPKLDALHDVCVRTFRSNLIGGVQSDCPGRERLGYGGDIVATCEAYMMNWDMREIYLKILRDFADEAEGDGWLTETAPYVGIADRGFGGRSGPISWSLAVPELMDGILRHYDDKRALDFYPVCARYVRLVAEKCPDGLVPNCIGDHEALERAPDGCTATAHWHRFVELTAKFAKMLGRADDEKEFTALAEKIRVAFVAKYVKDGVVANGTQSAQAIGLYLGLVPSDQVAAAEKRLVAAVEEKGYGPTTGIFSTRYMLMYLSEHGRVDLARKIVLHKGFPGWLHMIERGATTLWETWEESDNVYSNCHPMFGSVDEWILKYGDANADCIDELMPRPRIVERGDRRGQTPLVEDHRGLTPRGLPGFYRLLVRAGKPMIYGDDEGMRYAFATWEQLRKLAGAGSVPDCTIVDWPEFKYRGLMLDCGRNYQSVESIKDVIAMLAAYKMNVFHWHLTDNYGWRLESKKHPELQKREAFSRNIGKFYTQTEFKDVIAFAKARGVTVIPELDMPGHTLAFRKATGIDDLSCEEAKVILGELIDELCSLAPVADMPIIHLGTDEARERGEKVPQSHLDYWAKKVTDNGRTLMGWSPGLRLPGQSIKQLWMGAKDPRGDKTPYIDSQNSYYINHVDPEELLSVAAYQQPCRWGEKDEKLGAIIGVWHDDAIADTEDVVRMNAVYPAIVLLSDNFWRGREKDEPTLYARLPKPDDSRFALAADLERRAIAQRDKVLKGLRHPFPYVAQTQMRWLMTDEKGAVLAEDIPQATIYPRHFWFPASAYAPGNGGVVTLETWITSEREIDCGAWIGMTGFSRSDGRGRDAPTPKLGEWNKHGATVELNGRKIEPPKWAHPGVGGNPKETPLVDEDYWYRAPTQIHLKKGENYVKMTLPKKGGWKWIGTFAPILGTSDHPHEVPGLSYSAKSTDYK